MLLADFALVFTLIGDVVSGGVGEASSISSFGLIRDAGAAHVFFLSPGLACATWLGASVGGASAGGIQLGLPLACHIQVQFELLSGVCHWLIFLAGGSVGSMARFMAGDS